MKWSLGQKIYLASERALRNRQIFAERAARPVFQKREQYRYIATAAFYPLVRALTPRGDAGRINEAESLSIGSRKRAILSAVAAEKMPFDDLEYELGPETWRYFDLPMALKYYGLLARHIGMIFALMTRRSAWTGVHYAICLLEWYYLSALLQRYPNIQTVYCGYYVDRKALLLSVIRAEGLVNVVGVQHGAFNIFPTLHRAPVDEVLLIYPFSEPFAQDFFALPVNGDIRIAPEEFELGWSEHSSSRPFAVFGASADSTELNRAIIKALDETVPQDIDVLVKLHPRDTRDDYRDLEQGRVGLIDKNAKNAAAYIGQLSSVIAEAWTMNIPVAIMQGAGARGSDFQQMLNDEVCQDIEALKAAVAKIFEGNER